MSKNQWSDRAALLKQLRRLWDKGDILQEAIQETGLFPKRMTLKAPASQDLSSKFEAVRQWVQNMEQLKEFRVVSKPRHHRIIGTNTLPAEVWVDDVRTAVRLLKCQSDWQTFTRIINQTREQEPALLSWLKLHSLKALSMAEQWPLLLDFVSWCKKHPRPGLYLRQISLPGVDTKLLEQHRQILSQLLDQVLPEVQINSEFKGVRAFEQRYGFLKKPEYIRFRLLDSQPDQALFLADYQDREFGFTAQDFALLGQHQTFMANIHKVYITENEINFLTFPAQAHSLIIFGSGYGFNALSRAAWLKQKPMYYWGDIDTHGFAILDQLRSKFPHVQSLLMDEATLMAHRIFWGTEKQQTNARLDRLNSEEQSLYQALLQHKFQQNLRLEQERIYFDFLVDKLKVCNIEE